MIKIPRKVATPRAKAQENLAKIFCAQKTFCFLGPEVSTPPFFKAGSQENPKDFLCPEKLRFSWVLACQKTVPYPRTEAQENLR